MKSSDMDLSDNDFSDTHFDRIIDRRGTGALKTDALRERYGRDDLIPLWVADMDFESPGFIREAILRELQTPVLGYTVEHPRWRKAITDWQRHRYGLGIEPSWLTFIPGIVKGIALAICFLTRPGERVVIMPPVYHPFRIVTEGNGRVCVTAPLRESLPDRSDASSTGNPTGYDIDFESLGKACRGAKMLILSNPHNPGGRIWTPGELRHVAEICARHNVIVLSDEIHSDLTLPGYRHTPFASVSPEAASISITFGSPSKAFNIPALASSWAFVPDPQLRQRFFSRLEATELSEACAFQQAAAVAAYTPIPRAERWLSLLTDRIAANIDFIEDFIARHIPAIRVRRPQASYLVWLDCRRLGLSHDGLLDLFVNKARLALNDGEMFGTPEGRGFMRLNAGAPVAVLKEALTRLREAIATL